MKPIPALHRSRNSDEPVDPDAAKVFVMIEINRLIAGGHAVILTSEAGAPALRFTTGEIFQLGEETVTRVA